ncbi:TPA: hypothetical protein DCZ39_06835 [Patescibacteria group bacterium]|nr:hypothetical protein [Candidatus Gracilibacteria bacterium]
MRDHALIQIFSPVISFPKILKFILPALITVAFIPDEFVYALTMTFHERKFTLLPINFAALKIHHVMRVVPEYITGCCCLLIIHPIL